MVKMHQCLLMKILWASLDRNGKTEGKRKSVVKENKNLDCFDLFSWLVVLECG